MNAPHVNTAIQRDFQTDDVDDSVRDMWKAIHTDPNIPPLLTMPGIQSPSELVKCHVKWNLKTKY